MRATWLFIGTAISMAAAYGCGGNGSSGQGGSGGGNVTGASSSTSGSGSSSTSGASSSSGGVACKVAGDCPGMDNICAQRSCDNGLCGQKILINNMPVPSQVYGDCKTVKCDDKGGLSTVNDDTDVYDDGNPCTADTCSMGMPSNMPAMVGMMCGDMMNPKVCAMGAVCAQCAVDMDCMALAMTPVCSNGKCVPAGCKDMMKNGTETGTDCGGAQCSPCADGGTCKAASDCVSQNCMGPINNKTCQKATCGDGVVNGNETDTDCGGPDCVPQGGVCDDGGHCKVAGDCKNSVCKSGICQAPTCTDGVQNGTETGADCGGSCPKACP